MSIQALREQLSHKNREAKALLAEKGSQTWSKDDQGKFDGLMDEAERLDKQIEAHQRLLNAEAENHISGKGDGGKPQNEHDRGLEIFLRKRREDMSAAELRTVSNTMSTGTGSEGGYTVPSKVAGTIIEALASFGAMRRVSGSITTSDGAALSYPTSDGTSEVGEIVAENDTASDSDPSFGTRSLPVYQLSSKVIVVPLQLVQDSAVDIVAFVRGRAVSRIGRKVNALCTTGTGSGQHTGFVTAATVGKTGASGQTATIIYDDLVDMVDSLDVAYTDDAANQPAWMFAQAMRKVLRKLKDSSGRPLWTPSYDAGISGTRTDMLMDFPVIINNDMAAPAAGAKSLAFGQFGQYMIRDVMDVRLQRFDDSAYAKKNQVGFLAWARNGGNLLDTKAIKLYQHAAS